MGETHSVTLGNGNLFLIFHLLECGFTPRQQLEQAKQALESTPRTGTAFVEVGKDGAELEGFEMSPGESIHLLPGTRHRVTAITDIVMLEASTTELWDVVRLEDRYGREGTSAP